jgi:hypothetical protein
MSLQDDIDLLLTCAPAKCPREEACFRVARYVRDRLHSESPAPYAAADKTTDDDLIVDYAPHWEVRNGFVPCRDE